MFNLFASTFKIYISSKEDELISQTFSYVPYNLFIFFYYNFYLFIFFFISLTCGAGRLDGGLDLLCLICRISASISTAKMDLCTEKGALLLLCSVRLAKRCLHCWGILVLGARLVLSPIIRPPDT